MITKVSLALLLATVVAAQEREVPNAELEDSIKNAVSKINGFNNESQKAMADMKQEIKEMTNYFQSSINTYNKEVISAKNSSLEKVDALARKYVGEATDKGKGVATFKCLVKANKEAVTAVEKSGTNGLKCLENGKSKPTAQLVDVSDQIALIESTTSGLYEELIMKVKKCDSVNCVTQHVERAQSRRDNLKNVINMYERMMSALRTQYGEVCIGCIRSAQGELGGNIRNCENTMKGC